jgi:PIN domain
LQKTKTPTILLNMSAALIFVDANVYLDLYRMVPGKKLLAFLEEQHAHIFISQQIVDEVTRNKLDVANTYFSGQLAAVARTNVPDHLLGISDEKTAEIRQSLEQAKRASQELRALAASTLIQISQSVDDVSKRLAGLFHNAIPPTPDQMQRARARKETGNPPGKPSAPLGDEITWEQFLTYRNQHKINRLWIVSRDGDYCTRCDDKSFLLNPFLSLELRQVGVSDIRCFGDLLAASEDFAQNAGVTANNLPTAEESKEIRKEIDALPPLYSTSIIHDHWMEAVRNAQMQQRHIAATSTARSMFGETPLPMRAATNPEN